MNTASKSLTLRLVAAAAAAVATVLAAPAAALAGPAAPDVPAKIQVGAGHKPYLVGHATGVQIYRCDAGGWTFVAPRAELYGDNGKLLTTHGAGPTWTANDGSTVSASRVDGVTVNGSAIPWLLLKAAPVPADSHGGRIGGTTYIQRIATTGGLMPAAGECSITDLGEVREVPYTADYVFWKATGAKS